MWICPECKEHIEYLNWSADTYGREYGTAGLIDEKTEDVGSMIDNWETDDSQTNETDNYEYRCSECDAEIDRAALIWKEENDEQEIKKPDHKNCAECILKKINCTHVIKGCKHCETEQQPEETLHNIIKPINNIISKHEQKNVSMTTMVCKYTDCKYIFVYESESWSKDEFYECPKCERINSKKEYLLNLEKSTCH